MLGFRAWHSGHKRFIGENEKNCLPDLSHFSLSSDGKEILPNRSCLDWKAQPFYYGDQGVKYNQNTGIKDRSGKDIYEGDFVKILKTINNKTPVVYVKNVTFFLLFIGKLSALTPLESEYYEVIGNIHQNPELLERLKN